MPDAELIEVGGKKKGSYGSADVRGHCEKQEMHGRKEKKKFFRKMLKNIQTFGNVGNVSVAARLQVQRRDDEKSRLAW